MWSRGNIKDERTCLCMRRRFPRIARRGAHQRVYTIHQRRLDSQIECRVIPEEE